MIEWTLVSLLAYNFPTYFNTEQELNAAVIIDKSLDVGEDPYFMVALDRDWETKVHSIITRTQHLHPL